MGNIFFTSDTNFFTEDVSDSPFEHKDERQFRLTEMWNKLVKHNDIVYHLGNFSDGNIKETNNLLSNLNGIKYLIVGSNDNNILQIKGFSDISYYEHVEVNGQGIILFHYPILEWYKSKENWHFHGAYDKKIKSIDVSLKKWNYSLVSYEEIENKINSKKRL